jgi:hypothetical protein
LHSIVHDAALKKTYRLDQYASAALLDSMNRLWLGTDRGEWGGSCSFIDLQAGVIHALEGRPVFDLSTQKFWTGVFGFSELHDGQVWAYGGTTHMNTTLGFIWRVDRGKPEELHRLDNTPPKLKERIKKRAAATRRAEEARASRRKKEGDKPNDGAELEQGEDEPTLEDPQADFDPKTDLLPTDRPYLPITQIIERKQTGAIFIASFSDLYETDTVQGRWAKIHTLKIRYRGGRPDSVGICPSIRTVLTIEDPGKQPRLLFGTRLDGLIQLSDGKEAHHALGGQFGADYVDRIENPSEGTIIVGGRWDESPWQFRDGKWTQVSFAPPCRPAPCDPTADLEPQYQHWSETRLLVERGGAIVTVSSTGWSPGTRTTARRRNGKPEVLGRESSDLYPSSTFITPDGELWSAWTRPALHFAGDRWVEVNLFEWPRDGGEPLELGTGLRAVGDGGPPWILLDRQREQLLKMSCIERSKGVRLGLIPLQEQSQRLKVSDVIPWNKSSLPLATNRGLRSYSPEEGKTLPSPVDVGPRRITRLARDGLGRLWLAGDGLAVFDPTTKKLQFLDDLPMLGTSAVSAISLDPSHATRVILAIDGRGIVFVRTE